MNTNNVDSKAEVVQYYYGKKESPHISSGILYRDPYYISDVTKRTFCSSGCTYSDVTYLNVGSSSINHLYDSSNLGTTPYEYVTESFGSAKYENGGVEDKYIIHNDRPGDLIKGEPIELTPWSNEGWNNGLEETTTYFRKDETGNLEFIKQVKNEYIEDPRLHDEVLDYAVRKKYENQPCTSDITYQCTEADLNKVMNDITVLPSINMFGQEFL